MLCLAPEAYFSTVRYMFIVGSIFRSVLADYYTCTSRRENNEARGESGVGPHM